MKDCDPTSGEPDSEDGGFDDEYVVSLLCSHHGLWVGGANTMVCRWVGLTLWSVGGANTIVWVGGDNTMVCGWG